MGSYGRLGGTDAGYHIDRVAYSSTGVASTVEETVVVAHLIDGSSHRLPPHDLYLWEWGYLGTSPLTLAEAIWVDLFRETPTRANAFTLQNKVLFGLNPGHELAPRSRPDQTRSECGHSRLPCAGVPWSRPRRWQHDHVPRLRSGDDRNPGPTTADDGYWTRSTGTRVS